MSDEQDLDLGHGGGVEEGDHGHGADVVDQVYVIQGAEALPLVQEGGQGQVVGVIPKLP